MTSKKTEAALPKPVSAAQKHRVIEEKLLLFSTTIDPVLRKHFVNRKLGKLLEPIKHQSQVGKPISFWEPSPSAIFSFFLIMCLSPGWLTNISSLKFILNLIMLPVAFYAAWFVETKVLPMFTCGKVKFRLMRLQKIDSDTEFPFIFICAKEGKAKSGFNWMQWKQCRAVEAGDIVVAVFNAKGEGLAIIPLRSEGKLPINVFNRDLYQDDIFEAIGEPIKQLAVEFDRFCEDFIAVEGKLERSLAIKSTRSVPTAKDREAIWESISLPEVTKKSLKTAGDHFLEGSSAASRGLLLYGPPGTGKTLIAKTLAETMDCAFYPLSIPDLKGAHLGESANRVKELWAKALAQERAVIFIDECEGVFSRRGSVSTDSFVEEIVSSFIAQWDGFAKQTTVWVVGATNRRDLIDPAVISRFDEEVEIGLPDGSARVAILQKELQNMGVASELPEQAAQLTQGMSGRDIAALAKRLGREANLGSGVTAQALQSHTQSFRKQSSTATDNSAVWGKLVLPNSVMQELKTTAGILQNAEALSKKGINVPRGLLLYGPPGTGKTQIARTLANETKLTFIAASTADIKQGFIGQSGQKVRELFERARDSAPCLLFIDELDIVAGARGGNNDSMLTEIVGQLLQEMDGVRSQPQSVFVLAATNFPDQIDPSVLSRLPKRIEIPLPDEESSVKLIQVLLAGKPISFNLEEGSREIGKAASGLSGRDLKNLIEGAEQRAVSRALVGGDIDSVSIELTDFP